MAATDPHPLPNEGEPDDAMVGRALRGSILVLLIMAAIVAAILFAGRHQDPAPHSHSAASPDGSSTPDARLLPPRARFVDVTHAAGIDFRHSNGATGEKLLPETIGAGVAFLDYDADGDPDLLFVNGTAWSWTDPPGPGTTPALYRNDAGRFSNVTASSGLDVAFQGMGVACGDFDNDGWVDVFLTGVGEVHLFRNEGSGRFRDVTSGAGIAAAEEDWGTSAGFVDLDRDGWLDLFICHYVHWTRSMDFKIDYRLAGIGRAYGPPMSFPGAYPQLYRNVGGGRFVDVSDRAGLQVRNRATGEPLAKSLGVAPVDINQDGWMDLIVANDTVQNFVFSNRWDGTFAEVGVPSGVAYDPFGGARGAMGIDAGRFTDDASLGISIGNFANEMLALYVNQSQSLVFADEAIAQGLGDATRSSLTFGVFFFDYDLDGWLDLLATNGHIEEEIHRFQGNQSYAQPAQLFWNAHGAAGGRGFIPVSPAQSGSDLFQPLVGRGSAYADLDGDGDLDVVMTANHGAPLLLRNDQELDHAWIRLRLIGSTSNRDAIGAVVRLRAGGRTQCRQVMPTRGYLSQSELPVTFGLGQAREVDEVDVTWPSGARQRLRGTDLHLNALNEIREPSR